MSYTIEWMEKKTWEGKNLINATLEGQGEVTIWELDKDGKTFPGFADLQPGGTVDGTVWVNPKNGKKTLYPPKEFVPRGVSQAIRKADIKEAQDRKEESIAFFNATNAAIAIVKETTDLKVLPISKSSIQSQIREWRDWFLTEHKHYKENPPF